MIKRIYRHQLIASGIKSFRDHKINMANIKIGEITENTIESIKNQEIYFEKALTELSKAREFLTNPNHILGSDRTKHGEIAEQLEVNIRNAYVALKGQQNIASFDGIARTAPVDFKINDVEYQSKFYNGINSTLSAIENHMKKYPDKKMDYIIPKDQKKIMENSLNNIETPGYRLSSMINLKNKIEGLEFESGRNINKIVKPSLFDYDEVQKGKASETVGKHSDKIIDSHYEKIENIKKNDKLKKSDVIKNKAPSINEGLKVSGIVAAGAGTISAIRIILIKVKQGKQIQNFDYKDWKEIGLKSGKASTKAGVTAGSIYALTNLTTLSAPFAGAVTSAGIGLSTLMADFRKDQITADEFFSMGQILCVEAGIAATGGAIGQMLIPIPVLGAIIGTVTANLLWDFSKGKLEDKEKELKTIMDNYMKSLEENIESAYIEIIDKIKHTYQKYNSMIDAAFDMNANSAVLAAASVKLAFEVGVPEHKIIKNDDELDSFFLD